MVKSNRNVFLCSDQALLMHQQKRIISKFQPDLGQDSLKILKVNKIVMFHGNLVGAYIHNLIMEVSVSGMEPVPSHEECMRCPYTRSAYQFDN